MNSVKRNRMNDRIREILSDLILRDISDPRLQRVTVTDVTLDPELLFASVYVNALGDESRQEDVMLALKKASGYMRREMGKRIRLRNTPELHFFWDKTLEYGEKMNKLLDGLEIPPPDPNDLAVEDEDDELD
jgi:ribosome-binding factor A